MAHDNYFSSKNIIYLPTPPTYLLSNILCLVSLQSMYLFETFYILLLFSSFDDILEIKRGDVEY